MNQHQLNKGTQFIIKRAYDWSPVMNGALRTGLIGAGVGGAVQLGRRMFSGPNEEKPSILKGMAIGGLGGAGLGAGMGAGLNMLKDRMNQQQPSMPSYDTPSLSNSMNGDVTRMQYGNEPESVWNAKDKELGHPVGSFYSPGRIDIGNTNKAYRDFDTMAAGGGIGQSMDQGILDNRDAMHDTSVNLDSITSHNIIKALNGHKGINVGQQNRLGDIAANWKL